jgi:hypothetical protein
MLLVTPKTAVRTAVQQQRLGQERVRGLVFVAALQTLHKEQRIFAHLCTSQE